MLQPMNSSSVTLNQPLTPPNNESASISSKTPESTPATISTDTPTSSYRNLAAERIVETAERLERRIRERFGSVGLQSVAHEVTLLSREAMATAEKIARPNLALRCLLLLVLGTITFLIIRLLQSARYHVEGLDFAEMLQIFDSASQSMIFLSLAGAFLFSLESRFKRRKLLTALHELRSLAHIVDMHQLTKDPEALVRGGGKTESSPDRILDRFKLGRYLDYCSELLSLISKIGAIYVQKFPDSASLQAADQLSGLTNDLSRNVWQKIMILDQVVSREDATKGNTSHENHTTPAHVTSNHTEGSALFTTAEPQTVSASSLQPD